MKKTVPFLATVSAVLASCTLLASCTSEPIPEERFAARDTVPTVTQAFVHPGILHNTESLNRIRSLVDQQTIPQYTAFQLLQNDPLASSAYQIQGPFEVIARQDAYAYTKKPSEDDHKAAYLNALMWTCTGDAAHAEKSIEILNAYAHTLRQIEPTHNDAPLCATLQGFILVNAAELMKHTYPGVSTDDTREWDSMFRNVFLPVLNTFAGRAAYTNGNWGTAYVKAMMGLGVYLDDAALYNRGVDFYYHARDNGTIGNYIGASGQCQESGRDQNHTMLGLGHMAEACEVAWNQGDQGIMFAALDNRLKTGYEYTAKYNLGYDVPFATWKDVTGKYSNWTVISTESRGTFNPVFEIAYNHFATRKGMSMPYTGQALNRILVPETKAYACDHPGYGTLTFRSAVSSQEEGPGYLSYDFATMADLSGWAVEKGGTGRLSGGAFAVSPANQGTGKYRGDIVHTTTPYLLHPGYYPIMALRVRVPDVKSWVLAFDTNHGDFRLNGGNTASNIHRTIELPDGSRVFYWDINAGKFTLIGQLPTNAPTTFNTLRFKIADVVYNQVGDFKVYWIRTFKSVAELEAWVQ